MLARAAAERHEGADYLQRQAAAAARLVLPTRPCGAPRAAHTRACRPELRVARLEDFSTTKSDVRPSLYVSFYATLLKGGVRRRSENVFREKVSGKKKYVRGKRTHELTAPGRTVWVVRTGRRGG